MRKRILALVLAAAMVFGDAMPAFAAEMPEDTNQEQAVSDENSGVGGVVSDSEEETEEEQQPDTSPEDTGTEDPGKPEGSGEDDAETPKDLEIQGETDEVSAEPAGADGQLEEIEVDGSEYILQAGGSGILPEAENGGIALFSADAAENAVTNGLKNRETEIDVSAYGLTRAELLSIFTKVTNNHPEFFYVSPSYSTSYNPTTGIVAVMKPGYLEQYDASSSARYEAAVNEALESINDQMDDVEKALALHDYLALSCAYENDGQGNYQNFNAYNALVDGEAVCQGYTLAYTDLLQRAGISVSYATSDAMNHIWNLVELKDNWYHVDTTWDDPTRDLAGRVKHNNFLRSDEGITKTGHHDWVTGIEGITCTDDSYASGQFWNDLTTAVFFEGDSGYYMSGTGQIRKRSKDGTEETVYELKNKVWTVWEGGGYWDGIFTSLSRSGDYLYCNDKTSVYRIPLSSPETASIAYTYNKGDGYIYGSCVQGDKVHLAVAQDPNSIPTRKVFTLSDKVIHTWNTIDGGTADSSAPEKGRMKLLVFAPVWYYTGMMRHFYDNPLFRDNKYMDIVILDTQGEDAAQTQQRVSEYYIKNYPNAPIKYCYYKETNITEDDFYDSENDYIDRDAYQKALEANNPILQAYQEYRTQAGLGEYTTDIGRWKVGCFLINSENEVVYSDTQGQDDIGTLVENLVNEIHEKEYFHSDISASISFRKDEEGFARFEWEKEKGLGQALIYKDVEEEKVRTRNCDYSIIYEQRILDEGYTQEEVADAEGRIYYYQMVLLDPYGLEVAVSDIVHSQGDIAPNLDYTWNTIDGGTINSKNDPDKLKFIAFIPMKSRGSEMSTFYDWPLFHGKKYIDVVVLDSSGWSQSAIKQKVDAIEEVANRFQGIARRSSAMTYCYGNTTAGASVEEVFQAYCAQVGATIEFGPETVGYFQVDKENRIVDYIVITPERNPDAPVFGLTGAIREQVISGNYFTSDIPAPKVRITENKTGKIVLEWEKAAGAEGYRVDRADSWAKDSFFTVWEYPANTTRYEDYVYTNDQGENEIHYYRVASQDSYGITGEWSEIVTNEGLPQNFDPTYFKELHLVDEKGNRIESIDLHVGELKRVYLELERHNGQKVQIKSGEDAGGWVQWELVCAQINQDAGDGTETVSYEPDLEEKYATWWYEDLMNPFVGGVVGCEAMGTEDMKPRYLCCKSSGTIGGIPYSFQIYVPIHVEAAEEGKTYPPIESPLKNCYTDREELNQYIRDEMVKRTKKIAFCVPTNIWNEWQAENPWDINRDVMDFYQDREGMKSWEGDYLWHSIAGQDYGLLNSNSIRYQGTEYYIYVTNVTYWDNSNQDQKVGEKLDDLIWNPRGALYSYHDATEYEIVKACVDWIRKNVSYIPTTNPAYHSAYSALFNKKATCEGYSLLLYRMLREFGISNRILMGIDTNAHTYNIVEIDGKYYYTDPTSGAMLKGEQNFSHATWQDQYQWPEFTENVTSRISDTDYTEADIKWVRLYETAGQEEKGQFAGSYKTLAEAKEALTTGKKYRMDLLGALELKTADELDFPEHIDCTLNLNGRTLKVPKFADGTEAQICVNLYGGSTGKGSIAVAAGQSVHLGDASGNRPMTLNSVSITGTPDITVGSNVTVDAASNLAAGTLIVPETSANVVLDGTITAKTLKYGAADMMAGNLTVSGQTTVKGGSTLNVKGSASFNKVEVKNGIFNLNLVKTLNAEGGIVSTGTATFKDVLEKADGQDYAVEITRTKVTEGTSGAGEQDPFMPEDSLVTITGRETVVPTGYFRIPKDPGGRELSAVREGNVLKVKGVVVEVSLKDPENPERAQQTQKYISVDAAIAGIGTDFINQKGTYQFTFLGGTILTKNLTLPACVEKLELKAAQKEQGQLFAALNFQGFTLSTAAEVTLYEGLQLSSSGKQGKLELTGAYGKEAAFQVVALSGEVTWIDVLGQPLAGNPGSQELVKQVEIAAPKGMVVLHAGKKASEMAEDNRKFRLQNISAKGLFIEDGAWVLHNVVLTEKYQIGQEAKATQLNVTLTNALAEINGTSETDNLFTISNTRLLIGETGGLGGMLAVKTAYKNESAANGYTVENRGRLNLASLEMADGTLYNSGTAGIAAVKNCKNLINDGEGARFISKNFNQNSKGKISLGNGSVMAVGEKAVLYNAELGGAYFYQTAACSTALDGKTTAAADLPEETAGLEFVQISKDSFQKLWENPEGEIGDLPVEEIAPQTCLFTTKDSAFPIQYVSVRQEDPNSLYTKAYQIGSNVRVGREWIVISARKMDGEEERLESFIRWSDAMTYLSNLSNPNMTYIVHILDDVNLEQGLTMPGKAAGLILRGTEMPDGENTTRKNVLTYTGDLNLTMPLEFSGIELKAKKNGVDYESAVKVNGMRLTFSDGASAVFSSVKGNASSVLALNNDSQIEVHGEINVGQLWSDGDGTLTGLATVKRDKLQNITAVTPQITINGQTDIRNGQIQISLKEKITENKVTSYEPINFFDEPAAQIRREGVRMAKAPYAKPGDFIGYRILKGSTTINGTTMNQYGPAPISKKDGYLVCFEELEPGVKLIYGTNDDQTEIPFKTFAEAVAEINSLKTKQAYTIQIQEKAAELSKESPAALTMPNKNYISSLCIEAAETDSGPAELYYLNGLTLTSDTVLKSVAFKQMVKSGKTYVSADEQSAGYPSPVSLKTGGFALYIEGNVTFDTPLNLEGGNSGTFAIRPGASLVTVTNRFEGDPFESIIVGSVKKFKMFDVAAGQEIRVFKYGTVKNGEVKYTPSELNVTGMIIRGTVMLEGGNAVVKDLVVENGLLIAEGENAGKVTLTNVTLKGDTSADIYADRDFTISGTLDNQMTGNAQLTTRQKPVSKGAVQMPYLNITGKVTSAEGNRITVSVYPNDCREGEPVILSDAPKASGQLLTAKTAGIEYFAADPANLVPKGEEASGGGKGELYGPDNPDGYMLVKSGSNIYVYGSEQIGVALCKGDASDGSWSTEQVINYYPGWAEAVAALNGLNQTKDTYTLLLLKDAGTREAPLKLTLPGKAGRVYVASAQDGTGEGGQKKIYYQNALSLGAHTEFVNVTLHPVTAKGVDAALGISVGNFDLALRNVKISVSRQDGSQGLKDISGKGKGSVILESDDLVLVGGVNGVKSLTVRENTRILGAVKVEDLILQGTQGLLLTLIIRNAVTVTNIISRDGDVRLTYERTAKDLSNLTINGAIQNENGGHLKLNMVIPSVEPLIRTEKDYVLTLESLKNKQGEIVGARTALSDTKKLAAMPKASTSDFEFLLSGTSVSDRVVKANKGLYLADEGNGVIEYAVELEVPGGSRVRCLDYTQAVNEINTRSDGSAEYILYLPETCADTNITDNNMYGTLVLPGNGKAAAVTLSGYGAETQAVPETHLTFIGKMDVNGNVKMENLVLHPMKSNSSIESGDFNISVKGNAKNGGASLTLDNVRTWEEKDFWDKVTIPGGSGYIGQISGTKNVTNVTIKNSQLSLKTGITDVETLTLENSRIVTGNKSAINKLSVNDSTWDALGVTTITDIMAFEGENSYLAGKPDAKSNKSQLTVNGKVAASVSDPVRMKVIASLDTKGEVKYADSYKDVDLLKAPKEAAGRFIAVWEENPVPQKGWIESQDRIYYKDTANYILCGDRQEMVIRLTGTGSDQAGLAETYAKSWQDAVAIINNLNDPKASYTMELLKEEILTGKNGAFGGMTFPTNNKAASLEVRGADKDAKPTVIFSGNLTTYGNVTLENIAFRAMKNPDKNETAPFNITADGAKNASSLTLRDIDISPAGGALKDIGGKNKAAIILDSEGLTLSGGVSGTPSLTVQKDAVVEGAVKADVLTLQNRVTFTAEGTVAVTDVENKGGQNTLTYGRSAKNASNLTINGNIQNESESSPLRLNMAAPGKSQKDYELAFEVLKTTGSKITLNDANKLAVMPKVPTSDFEFCVNDKGLAQDSAVVKANKGIYLAGRNVSERAVELCVNRENGEADTIRCLDLTQAVNEINTLADGRAAYTLYLPGDYTDTNLTDGNPYGTVAMPGNGKAGSLTISKRPEAEENPVLTFSGGISANGNLTLEHLVLEPVKSTSNGDAADFNLSAAGNAKTGGASLTLDDVRTVSDAQWNWAERKLTTKDQAELAGFVNQISGTKNVTNVTIQNSRLRLKTGITNVDTLALENSRIITCGNSTVNQWSAADSAWDALGATTITDITGFSGEDSYLAGKQDAKKLLPQLTVNGRAAENVIVKVIAASKSVTEIRYVDSDKDVALLKAPKEAAGKFMAAGSTELVSYKDTANYVLLGDADEMKVKITGTGSAGEALGETYAKCWQDAVTIINNTNEPKAVYTLELLCRGEENAVKTGKGESYAGLTLPSKTAGVTVQGIRDGSGDPVTVLAYTGTLKPGCKVQFVDMVLTEGTVKKDVFTPAYQITLAIGNVNTSFLNTVTLKNPNGGQQEEKADLVVASAAASKGVLTLDGETVYAKGNFTVPNLCVAEEVVLIADKAVTLTDINKAEGAGAARLVLDTKVTAITRAGQQSVTQLNVKGKIGEVKVGIAPQMYDLSTKSYHRLKAYEARALLAGEAKPDAGKKLANVSKTFVYTADLKWLYSYEDSWSMVGEESTDRPSMEFYMYNNGLYVRTIAKQ